MLHLLKILWRVYQYGNCLTMYNLGGDSLIVKNITCKMSVNQGKIMTYKFY